MQYNVAQLLKEPTGASRQVAVDGGLELSGGLKAGYFGKLEILRTHQGLLVRGKVHADVSLACGRCLNEFGHPAPLELEEEFFPLVDVSTGRRTELPWDSEGITIDSSHVLDVSEVLRQYTIAMQPIKPLCQDACQGLCLECGGDLNRQECECQTDAIDPRWGALAALLNDSKD